MKWLMLEYSNGAKRILPEYRILNVYIGGEAGILGVSGIRLVVSADPGVADQSPYIEEFPDSEANRREIAKLVHQSRPVPNSPPWD